MQAHNVKTTPSLNVGYVDPLFIARTKFAHPEFWDYDHEELQAGVTVEEKEAIRTQAIFLAGVKVAARIARFFKNLQHCENIWLPYHFK